MKITRDIRTDGPMDGRTDGRTDGWADTTSYRDARAHLKKLPPWFYRKREQVFIIIHDRSIWVGSPSLQPSCNSFSHSNDDDEDKEQVEQSLDNRCVLWRTACVLVFELSFKWRTFLFLILFCSISAHFSEIKLVCDGPTDGRTD